MNAPPHLLLRLYFAGSGPTSTQAIKNLKMLLKSFAHELELIDVLADPDRALDDGICVTPTLVRVSPAPEVRIVGSLADGAVVRQALNLPPEA